ncbi:MAG: crossover junction endodeoxyribonuclease RuvC [Alphaproteobacteria bacterium]|nr:crossover junction endodeoxyribonuclease RuvC [Alphaproteobacteria bacterium]
MKKILGIDPGLSNTGWAVIQSEANSMIYIASGTITTTTNDDLSIRLKKIYQSIFEVISNYNPEEFAIEESFVNNNPLSSLKLGQARAAAILAAGAGNIPVHEYAPRLVKKAVVGSGRADKNQVASMVKYLIPKAQMKNEHEADALAISICHLNISSTNQRTNII